MSAADEVAVVSTMVLDFRIEFSSAQVGLVSGVSVCQGATVSGVVNCALAAITLADSVLPCMTEPRFWNTLVPDSRLSPISPLDKFVTTSISQRPAGPSLLL